MHAFALHRVRTRKGVQRCFLFFHDLILFILFVLKRPTSPSNHHSRRMKKKRSLPLSHCHQPVSDQTSRTLGVKKE